MRPLAAPFPNGCCNGSVLTIPRAELYSGGFSLNDVVLPSRDVRVWLPEEYNQNEYSQHSFPVLYCHDGQNAFEDERSWTGSSWRLVGALTRLHERNLLEAIPVVVCVPCAEGFLLPGVSRRHAEYGDFTNPISQAHSNWMAQKLLPCIERKFRVRAGPEHTSVIGSSLGGQASLQLLLRYPDLFGGAACMSPAFQPATVAAVISNLVENMDLSLDILGNDVIGFLSDQLGSSRSISSLSEKGRGRSSSLRSKRIYLDNGGDTDEVSVPLFDMGDHFTLNENWLNPGYWWLDTSLQPMIDAVRWLLDQGQVNYQYVRFPGGRHNERAWGLRIDRPLLALYGKGRRMAGKDQQTAQEDGGVNNIR